VSFTSYILCVQTKVLSSHNAPTHIDTCQIDTGDMLIQLEHILAETVRKLGQVTAEKDAESQNLHDQAQDDRLRLESLTS